MKLQHFDLRNGGSRQHYEMKYGQGTMVVYRFRSTSASVPWLVVNNFKSGVEVSVVALHHFQQSPDEDPWELPQ